MADQNTQPCSIGPISCRSSVPNALLMCGSNDSILAQYADLMQRVHGDAGIVATCYYLASAWRRQIVDEIGFFPHLAISGPPAAGKTIMARAIARMYENCTPYNGTWNAKQFRQHMQSKSMAHISGFTEGTMGARTLRDTFTQNQCGIILDGCPLPPRGVLARSIHIPLEVALRTPEEIYMARQSILVCDGQALTGFLRGLNSGDMMIEFAHRYKDECFNALWKYRSNDKSRRQIEVNYAVLSATLEVLDSYIKLPFEKSLARDVLSQHKLAQLNLL